MAKKQYYIGSHGPFQYDDTKQYGAGDNAGEDFIGLLAPRARVTEAPAVDDDAFRLVDANGRILIPVEVADIDDPTEISAYDGESQATILIAYQTGADTNKVTMYAYDTNVPAGANSPFVVDAATAGTYWVAFAGQNLDREKYGIGLLGPELVTNGSFEAAEPGAGLWTVGAEWSHNNTDKAMSFLYSAVGGVLSQTLPTIEGKWYRVAYRLLNWTSGSPVIQVGGTSVTTLSSNDTMVDTVQAGSIPTSVTITGGSGDDYDITDISVREILDVDFLIPIFNNRWSRIQMDTFGNSTTSSSLFMNKARGSHASPADVASGDRTFEIRVGAYSSGASRHVGTFQFLCDAAPSGANVAQRFELLANDGSALQYRQTQNAVALGLFKPSALSSNTGYAFVEPGGHALWAATKYSASGASSDSTHFCNGVKLTSTWKFANSNAKAVAYFQYLGNHYFRVASGSPTADSSITWTGAGSLGECARFENNGDCYFLNEVKGDRLHLPFALQSMGNTATGTQYYYFGPGGMLIIAEQDSHYAIRAGSIVGYSYSVYVAVTAVTSLTFEVLVNGTVVWSAAITNAVGRQTGYATQARGTDTFAAGDRIACRVKVEHGAGSTTFQGSPVNCLLDLYYNA